MSEKKCSNLDFGTLRVNEEKALNPCKPGESLLTQTNVTTLHKDNKVEQFNKIPGISKSRVGLPLEECLLKHGGNLATYLRERYIKRERVGFLAVFLSSEKRMQMDPSKFIKNFDNNFVADIALMSSDWQQMIVARVTSWIDCDMDLNNPNIKFGQENTNASTDVSPEDGGESKGHKRAEKIAEEIQKIRDNSQQALEFELNYYCYLHVRAIHIELRSWLADNFTRILKKFCEENPAHPPIWIQLPLITQLDNPDDAWMVWYNLRQAIGAQHNVKIVLNINAEMLLNSDGEPFDGLSEVLARWMAEPIAAVILPMQFYQEGAKFAENPVVSKMVDPNISTAAGETMTTYGVQNSFSNSSKLSDEHNFYDDTGDTVKLEEHSKSPSKSPHKFMFNKTMLEESFNPEVKDIVGYYSPAEYKVKKFTEGMVFQIPDGFPKCFLRFLKMLYLRSNTCFLLDSLCLHSRPRNFATRDPNYNFKHRRMSIATLGINQEGTRKLRLLSLPVNVAESPVPVQEASDKDNIRGKAQISKCIRTPLACVNVIPPIYHDDEDADVFSPQKNNVHAYTSTPMNTKFPPNKYEDEMDYNPFWMAVHRAIREETIDWYTRWNMEVEKGWGRNQEIPINCPVSLLINRPLTYKEFEHENTLYDIYELAIKQVLRAKSKHLSDGEKLNILLVNPGGVQLVDHVIHQSCKLPTRPNCRIWVVESNRNKALSLQYLTTTKWGNRLNVIHGDYDNPEVIRTIHHKAHVLIVDFISHFACNTMAPEKIIEIQKEYCTTDTVVIPQNYANFICPVQMTKFHSFSKKSVSNIEQPFIVTSDGALPLADYQPLFQYDTKHGKENLQELSKTLNFEVSSTAELTGFMGYVSVKLSEKVKSSDPIYLCTLPDRHTFDLECWYPMFFPIPTPIFVNKGDMISVSFVRKNDGIKMWYEWQLTCGKTNLAPVNHNGIYYSVSMDASQSQS